MRLFNRTFLSAVIFLMSMQAMAKHGEIIISSATEISPRDVITAYDIVETNNISREILERLKNIVVATGKSARITKIDLIKKLRMVDSYFMFPTEVKLLRSKQFISRMEVERKIKNHLLANCKKCDFRININSVPKIVTSDWEMDLNVDLNKKTVMVPVYSVSQPDKKGWITAEVKKYMNVAILNRDVKFGEPITEAMITTDLRYVPAGADVVLSAEGLIGMQPTKYMPAGEMISYRDLKRETVMKKGQIVKAVFGKEAFEVSISALAEESGAIGDVIKFKNMDSQKMFSA
ncbi:MAG: flagellar basal body P-ring formation protein FlgA [Bdellovibrionaceae bacterium]|nr:flagellar basal body P-ring formation protein FlgA [Pseudobdellovibrionaceae bacterium]